MKLRKLALAPIAAAAMMAFSIPASAATQDWALNYWGGGGTPTLLGFDAATVTVGDAQHVTVNVALDPAYVDGFVDTGGHYAFTFNVNSGAPTSVTINPASDGDWTVVSGSSFANQSFGFFTNAITCANPPCDNPGPTNRDGPLNFTIFDSGGINISNFVGNAGGWIFAADVLMLDTAPGVQGLTGTIGNGVPAIPEPETYAMMLAGLGLLGFVARRRRQGLGNAVPA
jgi:PEP-CTERM motif-containing protein